MIGPPFVFVSHSSKDRTLTERVCELLGVDPHAAGSYRMLVDFEDLKPNVEWPRRLLEWIERCHAAVVLLTKDAIASDWVLKEVTLLTARRTLNPAFKLFVVRFPDTDALLQARGYGPLFLSMIQHVGSVEPEDIATAVRGELGQPAGDTPFDALVGELVDVLDAVGTNTLARLASKLNVIPETFTIGGDERARHIDTVARHLVCGHLGQFTGVHEVVDVLRRTTATVVQQVLEIVSPSWIEPESAGRLPPLLARQPRMAAAMNGREVIDFTALMFLGRAHPLSSLYQLIPIGGGAHDRLVAHVTAEICSYMKVRRKTSKTRTEDIVAELRDGHAVWYALLPPPVPDQEALDELLDLYPKVTFILWTGEELKADGPLRRVEWLRPEVNVKREQKAWADYQAATNVLDRMPR